MIKRNVLIADDGQTAVLMDFGSMCQARIHIENRQEALAQQVKSKRSDNKFDGKIITICFNAGYRCRALYYAL